jgi:hypothetical protein
VRRQQPRSAAHGGALPTLSLPSFRATPLGGDGAALLGLLTAPQAAAGSTTTVNLTVNVTMPNGGRVGFEERSLFRDAVVSALREVGLNQTGDTLQIGIW